MAILDAKYPSLLKTRDGERNIYRLQLTVTPTDMRLFGQFIEALKQPGFPTISVTTEEGETIDIPITRRGRIEIE